MEEINVLAVIATAALLLISWDLRSLKENLKQSKNNITHHETKKPFNRPWDK